MRARHSRLLAEEGERVLDENIGDCGFGAVLAVGVLAVEHEHGIGILFDGAGLKIADGPGTYQGLRSRQRTCSAL